MMTQIIPNPPSKKNITFQLVIDKISTATGAVNIAPSGVPKSPKETANPLSFGVAQFATVLLIVENVGPSKKPNIIRTAANPANADPPNNKIPISPANGVNSTNKDQPIPIKIQTNFGPF